MPDTAATSASSALAFSRSLPWSWPRFVRTVDGPGWGFVIGTIGIYIVWGEWS